jgi:hypothetical protein
MVWQSAFRWGVAALSLALVLPACKYSKETVPEARSVRPVRVPNQQRLLALAVEEAVESLDFKAIAGKTVKVELTGILPESGEDLFDYLTQQVEAKLARSGVRVLRVEAAHPAGRPGPSAEAAGVAAAATGGEAPRPGPLAPAPVVPSWAKPSLAKAKPPPPPPPPAADAKPMPAAGAQEPDYRLLVGVSWGGIDTRDKVRTDEPLLFGQLSLAGGGILGGSALIVASDSTFRKGFSGFLMVSAIAGATIWFFTNTPFPHMYTLMGRVRVLVRGIPTRDGTAFTTEGNGTSKIIVDERNPEGFKLDGQRARVIESEDQAIPRLQHIESEGK